MSIDNATLASTLGQRDALDRVGMIFQESAAQTLFDTAQESGDIQLIDAIKDRAARYGWTIVEGASGPESRKARTELVSLLNTAVGASPLVRQAESFRDPRFSADGIRDEQRQRTAAVVADLVAKAQGHLATITDLAARADSRANAFIPELNPNDTNQLTRTAQAWEYTIVPVLNRDGATNWGALIDSLDADGLLAVQRFAPQWLATQPTGRPAQTTLEQILEGVAARLPHAMTDPKAAALQSNAKQVHVFLDLAQSVTTALTNVKNLSGADQVVGVVQRASVAAGIQNEITYPVSQYNRL